MRAFEDRLQLRVRIGHRFQPAAPAQERMDHLPLNRTRADDRDLHDDVVELAGFMRGSIDCCARDSIWKTPIVSAREIIS